MIMLELFSGTGSVGDAAKRRGWKVISLDRDMKADLQMDIMDWDYKAYPSGSIDFIWASPPCTEYSIAKTVGIRKIDEANAVVQRTLEIIRYFDPPYWVMENPQTGKLKDQEVVQGLDFRDVDYCKYGFPYRKRTRLWNVMPWTWVPRDLCKQDCSSIAVGTRIHMQTAQRGVKKGDPAFRTSHSQKELYRIPPELVNEIVANVEYHLAHPVAFHLFRLAYPTV